MLEAHGTAKSCHRRLTRSQHSFFPPLSRVYLEPNQSHNSLFGSLFRTPSAHECGAGLTSPLLHTLTSLHLPTFTGATQIRALIRRLDLVFPLRGAVRGSPHYLPRQPPPYTIPPLIPLPFLLHRCSWSPSSHSAMRPSLPVARCCARACGPPGHSFTRAAWRWMVSS
jgi:hypothetical protein